MSKERFFKRNKNIANRVIRGFLAKNKIGIVHGGRAQNVQLPRFLERKTKDWDVFVRFPRLRALQLEQKLDKKFRGDFFSVKKGRGSPGIRVFKVRSNINGEGIVDFATPNRDVPFISKRGVNFATLKDQVERARKNIRDPKRLFRRGKDLDFLKRVNQFEELRGRKI